MTRGCVRKCSFCAVWKIEPKFNPYISLKDKIKQTKKEFGDQRNLLLLDNNVLASKQFSQIIEEIKESGFVKGAKFINPNYLDIAIRNLKKGKMAISVYGCHAFRSMGATLKDSAMLVKKSLIISHYIFSQRLSLEVNSV